MTMTGAVTFTTYAFFLIHAVCLQWFLDWITVKYLC